jgi:hypothetical protein
MTRRISADSGGLVMTIIAVAPMKRTRLRSAIERLAPTADLICVASAVSRETISPERAASKNAGDRRMRWPKRSRRRSATIRSPSLVTR